MATTSSIDLAAAVAQAPEDATLLGVFADALEEDGLVAQARRIRAGQRVLVTGYGQRALNGPFRVVQVGERVRSSVPGRAVLLAVARNWEGLARLAARSKLTLSLGSAGKKLYLRISYGPACLAEVELPADCWQGMGGSAALNRLSEETTPRTLTAAEVNARATEAIRQVFGPDHAQAVPCWYEGPDLTAAEAEAEVKRIVEHYRSL